MFLLILENILKQGFKNASCIPLYAFIFAWSAHFKGAYFEILDLDSASPFPSFKSSSWQWLYLTLMPKLIGRMDVVGPHSLVFTSQRATEVKGIMLVWSWHQRLMPAKSYLLCVSFNLYKVFRFLLIIHIRTTTWRIRPTLCVLCWRYLWYNCKRKS